MEGKKFAKYFLIFLIFIFVLFLYSKLTDKKSAKDLNKQIDKDQLSNSNIINEVSYISKDKNGNEYIIEAEKGEIDLSDSGVIFLTDVKAKINLQNSNVIDISSDFGKYNIKDFDTIFSKNVIMLYLDNKITGEYLDFSINRSSMVISRNVVYTNFENILKTDVVEIDINTKDTKIFMYEEEAKVNIKSKN